MKELKKKQIEKEVLQKKLEKMFKPLLKVFFFINGISLLLFLGSFIVINPSYFFLFFLLSNFLLLNSFIKVSCYHYSDIKDYFKLKKEIEKQEYFLKNEKIFQLINEKKAPFKELEVPITLQSSTSYKLEKLKQMKELFLTTQINQIIGDYPKEEKKLKKEKK